MKLGEIIKIVNGKVLTEEYDENQDIVGGYTADLMSDVLASIQPDSVLLTGLCNPQVVRTGQMADVRAIIFAVNKNPTQETINLANQENIPLITSPYGLYEMSGRLYQAGLPGLIKVT